MRLRLSSSDDPGAPLLDNDLPRITVLLGANGSGKTRTLDTLKLRTRDLWPDRSPLFFEGARETTKVPDELAATEGDGARVGNRARAAATHEESQVGYLRERIDATFHLLKRHDEEANAKHADAVVAWSRASRTGPPPAPPESSVGLLLTEFQRVIPHIRASITAEGGVRLEQGQPEYRPIRLSEGERQAFALLADAIAARLREPRRVVLVDEPELHLHPGLAVSLWDAMERLLPDSVFVYGTHSALFAMRSSVERIILLRGRGVAAAELTGLDGLSAEERLALLGGLPLAALQPRVLVVEGVRGGLDDLVWTWLVGGAGVSVLPAGSCYTVERLVGGAAPLLEKIPGLQLAGLVDRDFRSVSLPAKGRLHYTPYHEVESLLCHPQFLSLLGQCANLTDAALAAAVVDAARSLTARAIAHRAAFHLHIAAGIPAPPIADNAPVADAEAAVRTAAIDKASELSAQLDLAAVNQVLGNARSELESALAAGDIDQILALVPGKELYGALRSRLSIPSPEQAAREASKGASVAALPRLQAARDDLLAAFAP